MEPYSINFSVSALSPLIITFLRLFCLTIVIPFYGWEVSHCRSVCHNSFIHSPSMYVWVILKTWEGISHPVKLDGDISESKTAHLVLVMEPQGQGLHMVNSTRLIVLSIAFVLSIAIRLMVDTLGLLVAFLLLIWGFCVAVEHRQPNILESFFEEWSVKGSVMRVCVMLIFAPLRSFPPFIFLAS